MTTFHQKDVKFLINRTFLLLIIKSYSVAIQNDVEFLLDAIFTLEYLAIRFIATLHVKLLVTWHYSYKQKTTNEFERVIHLDTKFNFGSSYATL